MKNIGDDPIAAAEALVEEFGSVHEELYQCIGKAVAIAEALEANEQKCAAFEAHSRRKGLHVAKSPLRTVMCFLLKAKKPAGSAYDRACCYTRGVNQLRKNEGASAANIAELIRERGGVEELYAQAKAESARATNEDVRADDGSRDSDVREDAADGSPAEATVAASTRSAAITNRTGMSSGREKNRSKHSDTDASNAPRKYTKGWCEQRLVLEIPPAKLRNILNMHHRQRGSLDFVFGGKDDAGFKIFSVDNVQLK